MGHHVELLGGLRLCVDGQTITRFRSQKTALLLAYLSRYAGRQFGREELIERFWPELELEAGRNALRVALTYLRKLLESPPIPAGSVLSANRTHISLSAEAVTTDVAAFERFIKQGKSAAAIALYKGEFLPGFYDNWVQGEQERLQTLRDRLGEEDSSATNTTAPAVGEVIELPGSLPVVLSRFFGRDIEQAMVLDRLIDPTVRLVTLTGPGGTGKTRLAIEVGRTLRTGKPTTKLPGGVWFVPLASANDPEQIPYALCERLGLPKSAEITPMAQLQAALGKRRSVFLLDNLEQFPAEPLVTVLIALLAALPFATVLVTSRRRVGLPGESVIRLSPLPLPDSEEGETLAANPAVALFVARAQEADVDFFLTPRNAEAVRTLCQRLEGVPLALELAASWMGTTTPRALSKELTSRLATLAGRDRGKEERHRSLQATLDWSLDHLSTEVARTFRELSIFADSFTEEDASAVAGADRAMLASLMEHSLILTVPASDPRRFRLLETMRAGGRDRLSSEDWEALQERHARYFLSFELDDSQLEEGNSALRFYETQDKESALILAARMTEYWWVAGQWSLGKAFWDRLLATEPEGISGEILANAWRQRGKLAYYAMDDDEALRSFQRSRELWEELGNPAIAASLQTNIACIAFRCGEAHEACAMIRNTLPLLTNDSHKRAALSNLVGMQIAIGDLEGAEASMEQVTPRYPAMHPWIFQLHAQLRQARGDLAGAREFAEKALDLYRSRGEKMRTADILLLTAQIEAKTGEPDSALQRIEESVRLRRTFSDNWTETQEALQVLSDSGTEIPESILEMMSK